MRYIKKKITLPSPSLVISLVALFVALGGSAYAITVRGSDILNGSITDADIKNRSLKGTKFQLNSIGGNAIKASSLKPRTFAGRLFKENSIGGNAIKESTLGPVPQADGITRQAVVSNVGQLVRGRGVAANGVARTAEGVYQVTFDREVASCAYFALLADPSTGAPPSGQIGAGTSPANPNAVVVRTTNQNGADADRPFHLTVSC